jgi:ribosomal protein S18 acetylase RimI-like enzyme
LRGDFQEKAATLAADYPANQPWRSTSRDSDADSQRVGEIASIYVDPAFWGTGVGRALSQEAIQRLVASGFAEISLWVLATNERARRFYEKAGFTLDGTVKEKTMLGAPVKIVRYRKNLTEFA